MLQGLQFWVGRHSRQGLLAFAVQKVVQQAAQVVLVHVGLKALGEGGLPPEVDCYGGVLAVYLVPPTFRDEQCIPSLHTITLSGVMPTL